MNIKLKDQIRRLEVEVKVKQTELDEKSLEIRDLTEEIEELRQSQKQMRRQSRAMETQVKTLYEEREEILAEMQDQHKTFLIFRDHLGIAEPTENQLTLNDVNSLVTERSELLQKIEELEKEVEGLRMGKFGDKMQEKIDELVGSVQVTRNTQVEAGNQESKFKKL